MMLENKVAIVTGAAGGIGREIALGLAAAGASVIVNDIGAAVDGSGPSATPADDVVREIKAKGGRAVACYESVDTMKGGLRIVEVAEDAYGRLDALICAAGILRPASIFDMSERDWDDVVRVHLKGHFAIIQPACRVMRKQQSGSIITCTSSGGLEGNPAQPNYSAAKEGIIGLTRAVALSIAPYATCNSVWPSAWTRMTQLMAPPGRVTPPPEMTVPLFVYLASDAARHITGQVINISGEKVALFPQPRPLRVAFRSGGWTAEELVRVWDASMGIDKLVRYDRFMQKSQGKG